MGWGGERRRGLEGEIGGVKVVGSVWLIRGLLGG